MNKPNTDDQSPLTNSVEKLRQELDRFWEFAMDKGGKAMNAIGIQVGRNFWEPPVELSEAPEVITVRLDLPGIPPDSIDITLQGNMLTVSGEKRLPVMADNQTCHVQERAQGRFSRAIPMPSQVDSDSVSADFKQGVLTILLTKTELAKPHKISLTSGD